MLSLMVSLIGLAGSGGVGASDHAAVSVVESRTVRLTQTVTLSEIPGEAGQVRMWAPLPGDAAWQRVLDRRVVAAPGDWRIETQPDGRGEVVYVDFDPAGADSAAIVVECVVERLGTHAEPGSGALPGAPIQPGVFGDALDAHAPLMAVDPEVQAMADEACGTETDPARQAWRLLRLVAEVADHYSKSDKVPTCGRGAAEDCLAHGGGCCTDLHSLFIALARARGIPARMQYGYRLLDGREGETYDPGYRCWVEFFVPGAGWIPTDIVAADNAPPSSRRWVSLSSTRVWLWSGRSFDLAPATTSGPVHTMLCGWAEIDGQPVEVLPADDGTPSRLKRTVRYDVIEAHRDEAAPRLPQ